MIFIRKLFLILLCVICFLPAIKAGNFGKGLRAIKNKEYEIARSNFYAEIKAAKKIAAAAYHLGRLYSDPNLSFHNLDSSFYFYDVALKNYSNKKAIRYFKKLKIDKSDLKSQILLVENAIDVRDFTTAKSANTLELYNIYLKTRLNSSLRNEIIRLRDRLAYDFAEAANTEQVWTDYIESYKGSELIHAANVQLYEAAYLEAQKKNSIEGYEHFLYKYIDNFHTEEAWENLYELYKSKQGSDPLKEFLNRYPNSPIISKATIDLQAALKPYTEHIVAEIIDGVDVFFNGLSIVNRGDKFGLIDAKGRTVAPIIYEEIGDFSCGLALVSLKEKFGFINTAGEVVIPIVYDMVSDFYLGYAVAIKGGKAGLINTTGFAAIDFIYDAIQPFSEENLALVNLQNKVGFINPDAEIVIPVTYNDATPFQHGFAKVKQNKLWGVIDTAGKFVLPPKYEEIIIQDSTYIKLQTNKKWGLAKIDGSIITNPKYDFIGRISKGKFSFKLRNLYGFADTNGKVIVSPKFQHASVFSDGFAFVLKKGKWGLINQQGDIVVPLIYDALEGMNSGLLLAKKAKKYGYINSSNQIKIPFIFDKAQGFSEGWAVVSKNEKTGIIDTSGNMIAALIYDEILAFEEQFYRVGSQGKFGLINSTGKFILEMNYNFIGELGGGLFLLKKNNKAGYADKEGNLLIPLEFDEGENFSDGCAWVKKGLKWYVLNLKENFK